MTELKICSFNCRGLGNYNKRRDVFDYLRRSEFNIYMLQDIHCDKSKCNVFRNAWGTDIFVAPYKNNARGVAILTRKVKLSVCELKIDEGGNYIIVKAILNDTEKLILVNIYGPNNDNPNFYEKLGEICAEMGNGSIPFIIAGDLNMALNGKIDTVNYVRENNTKARDVLLRIMEENDFIDIFREREGNLKQYTWRNNGPLVKQARLDYIIISRSLIPQVSDVNIIPGYRSDHSMVTLKLGRAAQTRGKGFFKINNSLLFCEDYCAEIQKTIVDTVLTYARPVYAEKFVRENVNGVEITISWSSFWEVLILNLRTTTLSFAIHKKRSRDAEEKKALKEVTELEKQTQNTANRKNVENLQIAKERLELIRKQKLEGIIVRSRAKWYEEGERSSSYFLSLEKQMFSDKLIASMKDDNDKLITNQKQIMNRIVDYYREVFKKRSNDMSENFMKGIHIKQISSNERAELEAPLELRELEAAMKGMSRNKTPGSDGFSVEFYQRFWNDIKHFFIHMVMESVQGNVLPKTLSEGILTLVPKANRPRSEIKSYRPITLLNVSYKIIAAAVARRFKKVLPSIIDKDQTGFMSGRFIGDNTRLTYDLIQELKNSNRSALFLSLDIEDAFNAVDWEFAKMVMRKRNFPETAINLFNMLYVGSYSRLVYNGNISEKIMLERSCRQGDPLSPYIFLIVIECALEMIRSNNIIKGVKIGGKEYKISAYADDVVCFLDGNANSCRALFDDLGVFAKYSGLKPNISKTQAFWAGVHKEDCEEINANFSFKWTTKLKVLGITFANNDADTYDENFECKLKTIQSMMHSWKRRYLTVRGRIVVVKSLLLPKLTHVLISLPKPPHEFIKRLKTTLFHFIWGGKVDRLRRLNICKPYDKGGLAMLEIDTYINALKTTWVRREIKSSHSWTSLFLDSVAKGRFFWEMNSRSLTYFSKSIANLFWAEVLTAYASLSNAIEIDVDNMNRCGLWYSDLTGYKNTRNNAWFKRGMRYISDIIDTCGKIISFEKAKQVYNINGSFLDYMGLIRSLPDSLKSASNKVRAEYPVIHPQLEIVLQKEKGAKYLYDIMLVKKTRSLKNPWERTWEQQYGEINWDETYRTIFNKTSVYYHVLSYKIITRIAATNRMLYQMGINDSPICSRCRVGTETLRHKFWDCSYVNEFWEKIANFINDLHVIRSRVQFTSKKIFLGVPDNAIINLVTSKGKSMIVKVANLCIDQFILRFKIDIMNEKCMAQKCGKLQKFEEVWGKVNAALD